MIGKKTPDGAAEITRPYQSRLDKITRQQLASLNTDHELDAALEDYTMRAEPARLEGLIAKAWKNGMEDAALCLLRSAFVYSAYSREAIISGLSGKDIAEVRRNSEFIQYTRLDLDSLLYTTSLLAQFATRPKRFRNLEKQIKEKIAEYAKIASELPSAAEIAGKKKVLRQNAKPVSGAPVAPKKGGPVPRLL